MMVSPPPPPPSPSGSRPSCPWPFNLLILPLTANMRRRMGVTINAYTSLEKSGKSRRTVIDSSKLDPMKNDDIGSSGESDESGDRTPGNSSSSNEQKQVPDLEPCSAGAKETLSPMFCATSPGGGGGGGETSKNKSSSGENIQFNADFWEKALSAGEKGSSGHHLPFIFSARDSLESSGIMLKKSKNPFTVVSMRPLSMGSYNTIVDRAGSLVVGIEESSSSVNVDHKAISKMKKHQERCRREREKDAVFVEKGEQQQQQQQKKPQPDLRRPKSFKQRRKSSGASSSASSGRFSVASIAPRWSLDSSASNSGGITSQSETSESLPPKANRKSGGSNSSSSNSIGGVRKGSMPTPRRAVIKSADMAEDVQQDALACAVRAMDEFDLDTDIAAYIKKEFDKKHGAKWHCVVGKHFGSFVTHETRGFIYLYRGQVAVLLFKAG